MTTAPTVLKAKLKVHLDNPNMAAFLRVIRAGETSQNESAYHTLVGDTWFESLDKHPRTMVWLPNLRVNSSAAGAYQFLGRTWDECVEALALPDFGKSSQDVAAVFLIRRRGALDDVLAGHFEAAIRKCAKEWASLPGSPYGQPVMTITKAKAVYAQYGGSLNTSPAPVPISPKTEHVTEVPEILENTPVIKENTMPIPAVLMALLPTLIQYVPKLANIFGSGSAVSERNVAAVTMAMNIAQETLGTKSAQEAIEIMTVNPEAVQQVKEAIESRWLDLSEAGGGGIDGAHKRDMEYASKGVNPLKSPSFWFLLFSMPLVYGVMGSVVGLYGQPWSDDVRAALSTAVVSLVIGGGAGYYWGQVTSRNRTNTTSQT
jgi:muramidase (phage lysozyme)